MRSSALDNLAQDYIRLARAKGLSERAVLFRHLLRNACLPMITLVGLSIPTLLAGNLLIEYLFNYPGLGLLFYNALGNQDYNILLAYTILGGILTVLGNLIADIAITVADPRVRLELMTTSPAGHRRRDGRSACVAWSRPRWSRPPEGGEVQVVASGWRLALREFAENKLALSRRWSCWCSSSCSASSGRSSTTPTRPSSTRWPPT